MAMVDAIRGESGKRGESGDGDGGEVDEACESGDGDRGEGGRRREEGGDGGEGGERREEGGEAVDFKGGIGLQHMPITSYDEMRTEIGCMIRRI